MKFDIDKLTESELIDLNHRVVERLRLLNQMHAHVEMLEFKIGDRVVFQTDHRGLVEGMLTRYNRNVPPGFLRKAESRAKPEMKALLELYVADPEKLDLYLG